MTTEASRDEANQGRGGAPRRGRRELTLAVLLTAAGGGLALYAASRQWWVTHTPRLAPLPDSVEHLKGREVAPWVPAMGFVGLAGAAALLATRRLGRLAVGVLLTLAGIATVGGGVVGLRAEPDEPGQRVDAAGFPPSLALAAGALLVGAGLLVAVRFRNWQTKRAGLGSRYDSPGRAREKTASADDPAALWDAIDRGEDPTVHEDPMVDKDTARKDSAG